MHHGKHKKWLTTYIEALGLSFRRAPSQTTQSTFRKQPPLAHQYKMREMGLSLEACGEEEGDVEHGFFEPPSSPEALDDKLSSEFDGN